MVLTKLAATTLFLRLGKGKAIVINIGGLYHEYHKILYFPYGFVIGCLFECLC